MSGASLGAAAGAILAGPISDCFGRKKLLVFDAALYSIGAIWAEFEPMSSAPSSMRCRYPGRRPPTKPTMCAFTWPG